MTAIRFILANPVEHRQHLFDLTVEYMSWNEQQLQALFGMNFQDIVGSSVVEYVERNIEKACGEPPPQGAFYLLEFEGQIAGMGGLRRVRPGVCELKRFFVRPVFRGHKLGQALLERVLQDAKDFGYASMWLDTGPFMHAAHALYLANGFVDRGPYPESEVSANMHDRWRFFERQI